MRQRWAKHWVYQLKHHPYWLVFVLWLVGAPSTVILVDHFINQSYQSQLNQSIEQAQNSLTIRANQVEYDLTMIMSRFKELPHVLSTHELFIEALSHPNSANVIEQANKKLQNIAHFLAIDLIMLIDAQGYCIAASNHDTQQSIVGANLADRRYVQTALKGRMGHQYAVGRKTAIPGFFFSAPVYAAGVLDTPLASGMVATKLNLEQALQRVHLGNALLVNEQHNIIFAQDTSWLGYRLIEHSQSNGGSALSETVTIAASNFGHPHLKSITGVLAPVLIHKLQPSEDSFKAYLIEPIPELLPLRVQYDFFYPLVLLTSLGMLWALLASLVFTRRSQLDRRAIHQKNHELILLNQQLKQQAESDFLTGCLNRRHFDKTLREFIAESQASTQLCLALFDVDHFKRVNDSYGHDLGDKALQHISGFVRDHMRMSDILSRIGGEEFTLIMPNTTLDEAKMRLELIRADLAITPLIDSSLTEPVSLTISIGLTQLLPSDNVSKLLQRADHAMYHAKENGRNQTFVL